MRLMKTWINGIPWPSLGVVFALTLALAGGLALGRQPVGKAAAPAFRAEASVTPCGITFSDVPPDAYYAAAVSYLACQGVIGGYADGTFQPGNPATRGQLAKIVTLGYA